MQWDGSKNLGFSTGKKEDLYLPVDESEDAPTVAAAEADPASLLHTVKEILALRHSREDLQADAPFKVICSEDGKPFVFRRGSMVVAVNPAGTAEEVSADLGDVSPIYTIGTADYADGKLTVGAQSFVVLG